MKAQKVGFIVKLVVYPSCMYVILLNIALKIWLFLINLFLFSRKSFSLYVSLLWKYFPTPKYFVDAFIFLALPHIFLLCDLFHFATCIYENVEAITVRYMWVSLSSRRFFFWRRYNFKCIKLLVASYSRATLMIAPFFWIRTTF